MTTALALLFHLEGLGAQLKVEGESIRLRAPDGVLTGELRELIRDHKVELLQMLEARRKFHYPEASLFKLIGHRVATPQEHGELLSVHRRYCRIALERTGEVVVHLPASIIPLVVAEFAAAEAAAR